MPRITFSAVDARKLISVTAPFLLIIAVLVALSYFGMSMLSAARAFVEAESLWSKNQKVAVEQLERYAQTGDPRHYTAFESALSVPLGDHRARLALESRPPEVAAATSGFLQGDNDPRDVPGMIRLFLHFHSMPSIARAIGIWTRADIQLLRLQQIGADLRQSVPRREAATIHSELHELRALDATLTPQERHFSDSLGDASRQAESLLQWTIAVLAVLLTALGLARTRKVVASERHMAAALQFNEQRQKAAIEASEYGICDVDLERGTVHLSGSFMAALGYSNWADEVGLEQVADILHPDDRSVFLRRAREDDGRSNDLGRYIEYRLLNASGEFRWVRIEAGAQRNEAGKRTRLMGTLRDITEQKRVQQKLFEQTERALVTLDSISDAVLTTDADGRVDYVNRRAEELLGCPLAEVKGSDVEDLGPFIDEVSREPLPHPVTAALRGNHAVSLSQTSSLLTSTGRELRVDAMASLMHAQEGGVFGVVLVLRDVGQARSTASEMRYQATHDVLTGLLNRREFEVAVHRKLIERRERDREVPLDCALLYLDLDHFKIINDTCGHEAGDLLLRSVADLMKSTLRAGDVLARLGGDEFGILVQDCLPDHAMVVAEKIRHVVAGFRFSYEQKVFSVSTSIGALVLDESFSDYAEAIRAADAACYYAKDCGGDRVQRYHAKDLDLSRRQQSVRWPPIIHQALDDDRFVLHAQRIEPTQPGADGPLRLEVLLRMLDDGGRLIQPGEFLPAAERYRLISAIDRWVVSAVFSAIGNREFDSVDTFSLNLSAASIGDTRALEHILAECEKTRVDPRRICFELTETGVVSNIQRAQEFIRHLRGIGFRFALDDFGAGMASFGYLKWLPVDYLKIDGAFVREMLHQPTDRAMVRSIQQIARAFGIQTVAEFVENDSTRDALQALGVDFVQGYAVHRPEPLAGAIAAGLARTAGT